MTRTLAKHSTCGTCHHWGFIIFKLGKFQRVILSYYWYSLMLPFPCFRRIHRIRETFYFNGCTLPGRFVWTSQFAVSAFWGTEFWPFSAIGFLNINSQSCNSEQSRKKKKKNQEEIEKKLLPLGKEDASSWWQETSDSESISTKTNLLPNFIPWLLAVIFTQCKQMMCKSKLLDCAYFQQPVCIYLVYTKHMQKKW